MPPNLPSSKLLPHEVNQRRDNFREQRHVLKEDIADRIQRRTLHSAPPPPPPDPAVVAQQQARAEAEKSLPQYNPSGLPDGTRVSEGEYVRQPTVEEEHYRQFLTEGEIPESPTATQKKTTKMPGGHSWTERPTGREGENIVSGFKGGVGGIFNIVENGRVGFNNVVDRTIQPRAAADRDRGVTDRHRNHPHDEGEFFNYNHDSAAGPVGTPATGAPATPPPSATYTTDPHPSHAPPPPPPRYTQTYGQETGTTGGPPSMHEYYDAKPYQPAQAPPREPAYIGQPEPTASTAARTAGMRSALGEHDEGKEEEFHRRGEGGMTKHAGYSDDAKRLGAAIKGAWKDARTK